MDYNQEQIIWDQFSINDGEYDMRQLSVGIALACALLVTALPAFASEGDPLANSVLLPGAVGWILVGLALLLVVVFRLWAGRGPS